MSRDWVRKDFYKTLGVSAQASTAEIKKAYHQLARKYHPDANRTDPGAEAKFKKVSEAYAVLSRPQRRAEYDRIRSLSTTGSGGRSTSSSSSSSTRSSTSSSGYVPEGWFEVDDPTEAFTRFGSGQNPYPPTPTYTPYQQQRTYYRSSGGGCARWVFWIVVSLVVSGIISAIANSGGV